MLDLITLFSSDNVRTYWDARLEEEESYVGIDELFGSDTQLEDSIETVTGKSGYTPALLLNAPDSKTVYRERNEITIEQKKIPSFKEGMQVDEKHIIDLMKLEGNPNKELIKMVKSRMFDDSMNLYRSSRMTRELMVMQLLSTGKVSMASNGSAFTVDYGIKPETISVANDKWDKVDTANPLKTIREAKKKAKINGDARAICNSTTFNYLLTNKHINDLLKNSNGVVEITEQKVKDLIYSELKVRIYVNDTYYMKDDGSDGQVFPDNIFTLFPTGQLGKIIFAMTPEQRMLLQKPDVNVSIVDKGIAIQTKLEDDAVALQTKIAMRCLPRLDVYNDKIIITQVK